ncbi:hypothetical protein RBH26_18100, partial [Natronolimnohabitans sp. A-GB9]|uniref:hypothetical protein n=1 Tax=Natronolimnohabitans sp. A-GB9 TaxID=3069757 RepID=UPI0027B75F9C
MAHSSTSFGKINRRSARIPTPVSGSIPPTYTIGDIIIMNKTPKGKMIRSQYIPAFSGISAIVAPE